MRAEKCPEFSVSLPNRPGAFSELSRKLTAHGVRPRVFMLYTSFVMNLPNLPMVSGMCKLVVDDHDKAREALSQLEFRFLEETALLLRTDAGRCSSVDTGGWHRRNSISSMPMARCRGTAGAAPDNRAESGVEFGLCNRSTGGRKKVSSLDGDGCTHPGKLGH